MIEISFVMPALNEEANLPNAIGNALQALISSGVSGEIVVINDGSTDGTLRLANAYAEQYPFIRVISHETPKGIGTSFWRGAQASRGQAVALLPGDGENDAAEILRYLALLKSVDIVVPFVFNGGKRSLFRRLLSRLYVLVLNQTFKLRLNYFNGTVIYHRGALLSIGTWGTGFFYQAEILVRLIRQGYLYAEVPYAIKARMNGKSKAMRLNSLVRVVREFLHLVGLVYSQKERGTLVADSVSSVRKGNLRPEIPTPVAISPNSSPILRA